MNPLWIIILFMFITGVMVPPLGMIYIIIFGPIGLLMYVMDPKIFGDWNKL